LHRVIVTGAVKMGPRRARYALANHPAARRAAIRLRATGAVRLFVSRIVAERSSFWMSATASRGTLTPTVTLERIGDQLEAVIRDTVPDRERLFGLGIAISGFFIGDGTKVNPPDLLEHWALADIEAIKIGAVTPYQRRRL
jgi:hypothetical protein